MSITGSKSLCGLKGEGSNERASKDQARVKGNLWLGH
jgi:hypothetical protein